MNILWIIIWITVISALYECTSRMIDEQKEYNEKYPITTTYENEVSSIGLIDGCEVKHVKQLEVKTQNEKRYPTVLKEFDMAKCGKTTTKTETIEKQVVAGKVITSKKEQHTTITNEAKQMFNLAVENTIEKLKPGDKIIIILQSSDDGITFERGEITEIYNLSLKSICARNLNTGYDTMLELNQFVLESELSVAIETNNNNQLECDLCGEEFHWKALSHFSGFVDEKYSNHIHVCEKCKEQYGLFIKEIEVFK